MDLIVDTSFTSDHNPNAWAMFDGFAAKHGRARAMERHRGLTFLELIVIVAIVGILLAFLLPAVQYSREMSRRIQCSNNLRQFVTAVTAYEGSFRVFPSGSDTRSFSPHYTCLPFMEQSGVVIAAAQNPDVPVSFFRCPSDGGPSVIGAGSSDPRATTNYVCNSGTWWNSATGFDGPFRYWDDWAKGGPPFAASAMSRGLSNTSALSEIIHADGTWHRMRVSWHSDQQYPYSQIDDFAHYCRSLPFDPHGAGIQGSPLTKGAMWRLGSVAVTLYNHVTPPNQPSCLNGGNATDSAYSASSFHDGIVFVAYLDGRVTPCSEDIDVRAWRSLAPR